MATVNTKPAAAPGATALSSKELFLRACRREPVPRVPVWMMRQAGRYLPEYRAIREKHSFLEVAKTPDLAAEVSLQPHRRLGVDAVIVFSDILIVAEAMGAPIELGDGGPVVHSPVRTAEQVEALAEFDPEVKTKFLGDAIRLLCRTLGPDVPVLGFAAAPWTLACYMVQGGARDGFPAAKKMLLQEPRTFRRLLEKIARATAAYLKAQITAGASAVQLFDSWVGELDAATYRDFELPATQLLLAELRAGPREGAQREVSRQGAHGDARPRQGTYGDGPRPEAREDRDTPVILFTKGTGHLFDDLAQVGVDVLSVDWRADLAALQQRFGDKLALQGNVDPCTLLGPVDAINTAVARAVEQTGGLGHILNLGHGILPETPVENALAFVRAGQAAPVKGN
jgi:uroporphyrinogen decarboxylase